MSVATTFPTGAVNAFRPNCYLMTSADLPSRLTLGTIIVGGITAATLCHMEYYVVVKRISRMSCSGRWGSEIGHDVEASMIVDWKSFAKKVIPDSPARAWVAGKEDQCPK